MQYRLRNPSTHILASLFVVAAFSLYVSPQSQAATRVEELRTGIDTKTSQIDALEAEIKELDKKLKETGESRKTLAGTIKELDTTIKKLDTDIKVSVNKIDLAELNLERLELDINSRTKEISSNKTGISEILRTIAKEEDRTIFESLLAEGRLAQLWNNLEELDQLQNSIYQKVQVVKEIKTELQADHTDVTREKEKLINLRAQLADQKKIVDINRQSQQKLLKETQNKESNYKVLLAEKVARKEEFERELRDFESQLKGEIDRLKLPPVGTGVISWPVDSPFLTQQFGDTAFSRSHSGVYSGKGHNGIDLRASVGSTIRSARAGTVIGTGDTDLVCNGASYGRWVLIRHDNGLSTLYAHLLLIKVTEGQTVGTREIIGYSGNTGYSTGPHLHFTLYASDGVNVGQLKSKNKNCGTYRLPLVTTQAAYLNPLLYLPSL